MPLTPLVRIADLIEQKRDLLLSRWRAEVRKLPAAQNVDRPTLDDHVPHLVDELADCLRSGSRETIVGALKDGPSPIHGAQRFEHHFEIDEVVAEYNVLRTAVHDLVEEHDLRLQGEPFRILNRVLDGAIGAAVKTYAARQALEVQRQRENYLASVAHDLRAPLHALSATIMVLELTLSDDADATGTSQLLEMFRRNIESLEDLASSVVQESKNVEEHDGARVERRRFALLPLVDAVLHGFGSVARVGNTELCNEVPQGLEVDADPRLLSRILQNLLVNALTYAHGAEVRVGAREVEGSGGTVECWVEDTGMGIPEDALGHIFENSDKGNGNGGRSGMGLAIVRKFVEAHGGEVTAESEERKGSTFRFTLPRARFDT